MAQIAGVGPFGEGDPTNQARFKPAAFLHFFGGERIETRAFLLRQIREWALLRLPFPKLRENTVPHLRHETVMDLRE